MDSSLTAVGSILIIVFIGAIYYFFTNFDAKHADMATDRHVKKTMADIEMEKLKTQQEELRLKKEFFEFQKQQLLEGKKDAIQQPAPSKKSGLISYRIKDEEEVKKTQ